jgi:D-3-phosphoglycerate dehydrogenase
MKIAILDDYQDAFRHLDCAKRLAGHELVILRTTEKSPDMLAHALQGAEAVITMMQRTPLPRPILEKLPQLRFISQTGRNTSHIDVAACAERGIVLSAGGAGGANATSELTWALILAAMRRIPQEVQMLKSGTFQSSLGLGLAGKTLGIYALGRIGTMVARAGVAFDMNILCWGREGSLVKAREIGYKVAASREDFFSQSDVISLHIALNGQTTGIVTAEDLARMKPDALLVNTSRAQIIQQGALLSALKNGRPGRAAVDVYEEEPVLGGANPLLKLDNVICTPHLGYVEKGTYEALYSAAIDQVLAFVEGSPINVVNPAAAR